MTRTDFWLSIFGSLEGMLTPTGRRKHGGQAPPSPSSTASHTFSSISVNGHFHTLRIRKSDVQSSPAIGISGNTSVASSTSEFCPFYHSHTFAMTKAQLQSFMSGRPVVVTSGSSIDPGGYHSHCFTITKWF